MVLHGQKQDGKDELWFGYYLTPSLPVQDVKTYITGDLTFRSYTTKWNW